MDALAAALQPFAPSAEEATLLPMRARASSLAEGAAVGRIATNSFVRRRSRWGVIAAIIAVAALVGVASFVVVQKSAPRPVAAAPVALAPPASTAAPEPAPRNTRRRGPTAGDGDRSAAVGVGAYHAPPRGRRRLAAGADETRRPAASRPPDGFGGRL